MVNLKYNSYKFVEGVSNVQIIFHYFVHIELFIIEGHENSPEFFYDY